MAAFVSDDQPVGIAVEGDPDIGAACQHLAPHLLGRQGSALAVDIETIGRHPEREHLGTEFPEYRRCDLIRGAVRAIDNDAQPVEPQPARKALLDEFDVAAARIFEPLDPAQLSRDGAPARPPFEA